MEAQNQQQVTMAAMPNPNLTQIVPMNTEQPLKNATEQYVVVQIPLYPKDKGVRDAPDSSGNVLRSLLLNTIVRVSEVKGDWIKIGANEWVLSRSGSNIYLQKKAETGAPQTLIMNRAEPRKKELDSVKNWDLDDEDDRFKKKELDRFKKKDTSNKCTFECECNGSCCCAFLLNPKKMILLVILIISVGAGIAGSVG